MAHYNLALLGFGNVGRALARLLLNKRDLIAEKYGITYQVTGIATGSHGVAVDPYGINLEEALSVYDRSESLNVLSARSLPMDSIAFIHHCEADILFENTPVSYTDGQPAIEHLMTGLEMGMHAITANKGPVVHAFAELTDFARARGVRFLFESTVMDGAPIFSLFRESLPAARLEGFNGVLNSTTNLILTLMEAGRSFEEAVVHAQEIGVAETDPAGDIDGWDAAVKVAALVTVLMDFPIKPQEVKRTGIRHITREEVQRARAIGKRWKLVCSARWNGERVAAEVAPQEVGPESPLFNAEGTTSVVQFETDVLGPFSVMEANPGPETTAYGLLADFLNILRS